MIVLLVTLLRNVHAGVIQNTLKLLLLLAIVVGGRRWVLGRLHVPDLSEELVLLVDGAPEH